MLGGISALVFIAAAIQATSFVAIQPMTFAAAYPLLLLFWFTAFAAVNSSPGRALP